MPTKSFTISARFDAHQHPDGEGDGWTEHMRLLNGRLFYFEYGYTAQGYQTFRAYARVPSSRPGALPDWRLRHELHTD
ncbi:hypothetical protein [Streptomyces sp. NPDC048650]|uniref:hypothetical protein n=1 Tax=Streptomyces sp. NPDC048650 TaxID=3365583 RepID=UPI00371E12C2